MDDIEYQRQIIDTFINAIYVYDDKLVFTYNYKDGSATIMPEEIEEAFGSDLTQVAPPNISHPSWVVFHLVFFPPPSVRFIHQMANSCFYRSKTML